MTNPTDTLTTITTGSGPARRYTIPPQPGMIIAAEWTSPAGHPVCHRVPDDTDPEWIRGFADGITLYHHTVDCGIDPSPMVINPACTGWSAGVPAGFNRAAAVATR